MIISKSTFLPIEILLQIILRQYFDSSYCIAFVCDASFLFTYNKSYVYLNPRDENFTQILLEVSEMGCLDYVVRMENPQKFMQTFDKIVHLGNTRKSNRKVILLPTAYYNVTENLLEVLTMKESSFVANILIIAPSSNDTCETYDLITHKYVGQSNHDMPLYLDHWNSCTEKFYRNVNLFPHSMSNMYGKVVKVSCFTYKPYVLLDLNPVEVPFGRDGMDIRIVDEFCRWINCSIEIIRDDEYQWGEIYSYENMTGVGILGSLVEDRVDIGITALYSWYEEYLALDFSAPCIRTGITCIAPAPRLLASWETPFLPFSLYLWIAIIFTFLYASVALAIAQGCSAKNVLLTTFGMMITQGEYNILGCGSSLSGRSPLTMFTQGETLCKGVLAQQWDNLKRGVTFTTTYKQFLSAFLPTSVYCRFTHKVLTQNDTGRSWRIRIITGWLLITGLVLDNAYGGGLASTFTVPKYEKSIDTIRDIVDRKMEWGATHDAWTFSLTLSQEPLIKKLVNQFRRYSFEELKRKSFTRDMAFSIEKLPAGYYAIGEYITEKAVLDFTIMLEDFYYEQCVIMFRKSSAYTKKMSQLIGRLHESGLLLAWETQVALRHLNYNVQLEVKLSRSKKDVDKVEPLALRHVLGVFIIFWIGIMIACVFFLMELFSKKKTKK